MAPELNVYDAVAYPNFINSDSHPNRLAVMARLHGLNPAPVDGCRVLEVGCNAAQNLIPMAYALPESQFVGFDLASVPIALGQKRIDSLGLRNIRVFQANLMDVDETLGTFDYIIVHGVYAWVPPPVRNGVFALIKNLLAPEGIAFVSYNALPGSHLRNLVRDILLHGQTNVEDPARLVSAPLDFLDFVAAAGNPEDPLTIFLQGQAKKMRIKSPAVIFHDEMASGYGPVSFTTFANHAAEYGLQYVCESKVPKPNDPCFSPQIAAKAKEIAEGDLIAEEQTLDFARMRMYRETLLCHDDCNVSRNVDMRAFDDLRLASPVKASEGEKPGTRVYILADGPRLESQDPVINLLLDKLSAAWPESFAMADLKKIIAQNGLVLDVERLKQIFRLVVGQMIVLHSWKVPVEGTVPEKPRASITARQEAVDHDRVAGLLHTAFDMQDAPTRDLLLLLDGTRDRAALLEAMQVAHPEIPPDKLDEGLTKTLHFFHRNAALLADDFPG